MSKPKWQKDDHNQFDWRELRDEIIQSVLFGLCIAVTLFGICVVVGWIVG